MSNIALKQNGGQLSDQAIWPKADGSWLSWNAQTSVAAN